MTFVVILTGGIGCGKSTVATLFSSLGVPVIDTDEIARGLTEPKAPLLAAIRQALGAAVFLPDGSMDRAAVRARVFADEGLRHTLEKILHPAIRREVEARLTALSAPYAVVVVPLYAETGDYADLADHVVVVDCDPAHQLARAATRNGHSDANVRAIMAAQASREDRLRLADDVVDNRMAADALPARVAELHRRFLELASNG